jgi:hypothetical protein
MGEGGGSNAWASSKWRKVQSAGLVVVSGCLSVCLCVVWPLVPGTAYRVI